MPWQKRGNNSYYYEWRNRASGRKKVYFGRGPAAAIVALRDTLHDAEMAASRQAFDAFIAEYKAINELLRESHLLTNQLVSAEMIAAGYYRHDRGRWRKRR